VVLDNGLHESTGAQRSVPIPPAAIRGCGYADVRVARSPADVAMLPGEGPLLVRVPVSARPAGPAPRVSRDPREIAARFARALAAAASETEAVACG
jgi:phosphonopyruvate decarboxylase